MQSIAFASPDVNKRHAFVPFEHVCVDVASLRPYVLDTGNTWCCGYTGRNRELQNYLVLHGAILDETVRP